MTHRFKLPSGGDVPPAVAARRLALSVEAFEKALPLLIGRGFPPPDATTGNFDLDAIDTWRRLRHPGLFPQERGDRAVAGPTARNANDVLASRLARSSGG